MKVALVNLTSGGLSGGYKKYLEQMVPRLVRAPQVTALRVAGPPQSHAERRKFDMDTWPAAGAWVRGRWLVDWLASFDPDVVFVPTARAVRTSRPLVVMVRNMEPLVAPFAGNSAADSVRNLARRWIARTACVRATRVIAVSNHVAEYLAANWGIGADRVAVIPHGVDGSEGAATERPASAHEPLELFTAGSLRPARGLEDLVDALAILRDDGISVRLAIAGSPTKGSPHYVERLKKRISARGVDSHVTWLGELRSPAMNWCFQNCRAFVMTSRAEACPNTVLEAMSQGTLSISCVQPPMPEFYGDSAVFYRTGNPAELAAQIGAVWNAPPGFRERASARAKAMVAGLDWDTTATRTIAALLAASADRK